MSACLSIQISSINQPDKHEVNFYIAENWTEEAEAELFFRMKELIATLRPLGKSLQFNLSFDVTDMTTAIFLVNKKLGKGTTIGHHKLSIREIEILGLIMRGLTNNEIAEKLFISYETVKSHRKNILEKKGAKNTAALINYYHQTFFEK